MSCDIHFYVEKRPKRGGLWLPAEDRFPNPEFGKYEDVPETEFEPWYSGRNYSLFALLAGVRNYEPGVTPIAEPRGLPSGLSPEVKVEADRWECDAHSHSWFMARELVAVDWQQKIHLKGWVGPDQFYAWTRFKNTPDAWARGMGSADKVVSNQEMERRIVVHEVPTRWTMREYRAKHGRPPTDPENWYAAPCYTLLEWTQTMADAAGCEFSQTILRMARCALLDCGGDLDRVRCVFWFDN